MTDIQHLTGDQRRLWEELRVGDAQPTGNQTPAQALRLALASFRHACALAGVPVPSEGIIGQEAVPPAKQRAVG